jgi:two-component system response regulator NreC
MPYRDLINSLMDRLTELVGAPAARELARRIPGLSIDEAGNVLGYDHSDPRGTATLLIELYEAAAGKGLAGQAPATATAVGEEPGAPPTSEAPPTGPTRIVLVDDHALVREGLANLLSKQPDMVVVGEAGSVREAIAVASRLRPDLILMDFTLPDGKGDEATRVILSALPDTKIVFLTVHDDDERLFAAISAGATGYLLKSVRSSDLLSRLRGVIQGDVALSPTIARRLLEQLSRRPQPHAAESGASEELTEREVEILRLIVHGYTNRQIADTLTLSVRTVEYHRANLTSKLGLHSRADLVRYAVEHGLLDT